MTPLSSEKRNSWLNCELQSLHVIERRSKYTLGCLFLGHMLATTKYGDNKKKSSTKGVQKVDLLQENNRDEKPHIFNKHTKRDNQNLLKVFIAEIQSPINSPHS